MRIRSLFPFRKFKLPVLIVLFLLLIALILVSVRVKQRTGLPFLDAFVLEVCSPFQKATTSVIRAVRGVFDRYVFLVNLQQENAMLRQRVTELQQENHQMKEMTAANERLRGLLQFKERFATPMIAAEVIGHDPSSWFKSVTVNRGERDGVQRGMAVLAPSGVVGQILKTSSHYATVLLITDYNSAVDAIVQRTRAKAIVEGMGENQCQLKYLLRTEEVLVGDVVVTSGLGGNFPKGLPIGEVRRAEKKGHGVFQYAELIPSVDMAEIEEVLIIAETTLSLKEEPEKKPKKAPPAGRKGK
jgi:rod shape-determining protein MreC